MTTAHTHTRLGHSSSETRFSTLDFLPLRMAPLRRDLCLLTDADDVDDADGVDGGTTRTGCTGFTELDVTCRWCFLRANWCTCDSTSRLTCSSWARLASSTCSKNSRSSFSITLTAFARGVGLTLHTPSNVCTSFGFFELLLHLFALLLL